MKAFAPSHGVKIYNVSAGKSIPEWVSDRRRRKLQREDEYSRRVELLQDLEYPAASQCVCLSPDGRYLLTSGVYPPQVKVHDTTELSMKFSRHVDSEVRKIQMLSEDFSKFVLMQEDRSLEFHARFGTYYKTRLPKVGRDMLYDPATCDLYCCGSSDSVYRLNLEQGRFMLPIETSCTAFNACVMNPVHSLLCFGSEDGTVECVDPRSQKRIASLDVKQSLLASYDLERGASCGVTSLACAEGDSVSLGVGTSSGHCLLFDLRSSKPVLSKDHRYELPVHSMSFQGDNVISADSKIVKIWSKRTGKAFANVEPEQPSNGLLVVPGTGLMILPSEQPRVQVLYVPALGPAPSWCSFLDMATEQLESGSSAQGVYEDYKFVTGDELRELGASSLKGTPYVRPYMHGFFLDSALYRRLRAASDPFAFEAYRKQRIKEKLEEKRASRISLEPRRAKQEAEARVNQRLHDKLHAQSEGAPLGALSDPRFAALWSREEYAINERRPEYQNVERALASHQKQEKKKKRKKKKTLGATGQPGHEDDEDAPAEADDGNSSSLEEEEEVVEDEEGEEELYVEPIMYGAADEDVRYEHLTEGKRLRAKAKGRRRALGKRVDSEASEASSTRGLREMTFIPSAAKAERRRQQETRRERREARRGKRSARGLFRRGAPP